MRPRGQSGIWEEFIPGIKPGALYKFHIASRHNGYQVNKADPFGVRHETPPKTGSVVWELDYTWGDKQWMAERHQRNHPARHRTAHEGQASGEEQRGRQPHAGRSQGTELWWTHEHDACPQEERGPGKGPGTLGAARVAARHQPRHHQIAAEEEHQGDRESWEELGGLRGHGACSLCRALGRVMRGSLPPQRPLYSHPGRDPKRQGPGARVDPPIDR
ncbi:MAG: hypothetical protein ABFS46_16150 [Myxococcota bacterium]